MHGETYRRPDRFQTEAAVLRFADGGRRRKILSWDLSRNLLGEAVQRRFLQLSQSVAYELAATRKRITMITVAAAAAAPTRAYVAVFPAPSPFSIALIEVTSEKANFCSVT